MDKTFTKGLFILLLPLLVITAAASAQTITVGTIDPGPYGRGSSVTLPFHIDNTSGCVATNNIFKLVLSDPNGNFNASSVVLTTKTGFYETFLNGTIPLGAAAGTGYRLRIESTSPAKISLPSNAFTVNSAGGVIAGVTSQTVSNSNPEVFGVCAVDLDHPPPPYQFNDISTVGSTVTAIFYNEFSQTAGVSKSIPTSFAADFTNYTVIVKAEKGGVIGTKAYTLINNTLYSAFGGTTSTTVCLGSATPLTYTIPMGDDPTGKQQSFKYNYPGLVYNIKWGDGVSDDLTFCEINGLQGKLSHVYTRSSCGNVIGTQKNVFQVDFLATNPYCPNSGTPFTGYAKVLTQPTNLFSSPAYACTNTPVTFTNGSDPGMDPSSTADDCKNLDARYVWKVTSSNGTVITTSPSMTHDQKFVYSFPTHGSYKVTLTLVNSNGLCTAADVSHSICIQDLAKPKFTIPAIRCLSDGLLTPTDLSIIDRICDNTANYTWKLVSGPADGVTFNATDISPQFNFSKIGVYKFQLQITTLSCDPQLSTIETIVVNKSPTATLSPDATQCGKNITLSFDPTAVSTQTVMDGTAQTLPTTYTWTVTSPDGGTSAFATGSTLNSQYPRITFNDYATYNISVTHTNNCGTVTKTQQLKFVVAPTVSAGPPQPNVCETSPIYVVGSPNVGGLISAVKWTSSTGGSFNTPNSTSTNYTPSAVDIANGQVLLTYTATTSLTAPCNQISSTVLITLIKSPTITSPNNPSVCSGNIFNYTITASNPATTFNWTAAVISGTAAGYTSNGSGNTISDILTNNSNTDAVIVYSIIPTVNGCQGTAFALRVTVHPLPVITAVPVDPEICSNQPANITLTSNVTPTTYTWTSVASPGITGNTNRTVPATAASIQDVLVNTAATTGTVTYTVTPYNGTCPGIPKPVTITVKPAPKQSIPGNDEPICAQTQYQLHGNDPSPGTGKWTLASTQVGVTFSDPTDPNAIALGLQPGQVYKFTWTITAAPTCPPNANTVTITNNAQAVGGNTTGTTIVCAGSNGQVTLTGQLGNIVWQRSIDGGLNWVNVAPAQTTAILTYTNITQTTQYRASVTNGTCGPAFSTVTIITVVPPPPAANAGTYQPICNPSAPITLTANNPGTFVGKWTQEPDGGPPANIVDANNFTTEVTGLLPGNTYKFRWTIFAKSPCVGDNSSVATIIVGADVTPNFTSQTQVCGPVQVAFTNTSTPDLPGNTYRWDFGDGTFSTDKNPTHSFQPNADGTDVVRTVSLTVTSSCVTHPPKTADITISPATPVVIIIPSTTQACGSLSLTVQNQSLGTNKQYDFYLVDENGVQKGHVTRFDKTDAVFPTVNIPNNARWYVYAEATNNCDFKNPNPIKYPIDVAQSNVNPIMAVKDNVTTVCLGSPVTFLNLTANATIFHYRIYTDAGDFLYELQAGQENYNYTFPNIGKYQVSITASNAGCGAAESDKHSIEVVPLPQPDFSYTVDINNNVTFVNTTPDAGNTPASSLTYQWNFGDGSAVSNSFTPAQHSYGYENSPFTVSLRATTPGTNCSNITIHTIEIKFTGELFLPNAFQPAATSTELRTFKAKGQKLKEWRMQVFNNWGQLIWQTTALNSNGEPTEGWDGTFKGAPAQQGVYIWQITAKFLNGSDWKGMSYNGSLPKRSGTIHLIR